MIRNDKIAGDEIHCVRDGCRMIVILVINIVPATMELEDQPCDTIM